MPAAFTERGLCILSTILKSEQATETEIELNFAVVRRHIANCGQGADLQGEKSGSKSVCFGPKRTDFQERMPESVRN